MLGRLNSEMHARDCIRLDLKSLYSSEVVSVEAYVVPEISFIRNQHLEVVREKYAHLKGLWLSDVCMSSDELKVDVLVGADYLWLFEREVVCVRPACVLHASILRPFCVCGCVRCSPAGASIACLLRLVFVCA